MQSKDEDNEWYRKQRKKIVRRDIKVNHKLPFRHIHAVRTMDITNMDEDLVMRLKFKNSLHAKEKNISFISPILSLGFSDLKSILGDDEPADTTII